MLKIILYDKNFSKWKLFQNPLNIIKTNSYKKITSCLQYLENQVNTNNLYAVGYLAYEAAPGFDRAVKVRSKPEIPLLQFGLFREPEIIDLPDMDPGGSYNFTEWSASETREHYQKSITKIKSHIQNGNTYQVNYTFRLNSKFTGSARTLFANLVHSQKGDYPVFLEDDNFIFCSVSPELFFELQGDRLVSRPMKGTEKRGKTLIEDEERETMLLQSPKNRAENVMIVDMIRNDMGRIAEFNTVKVSKLFEIEKYPTVLQMTSTITCETKASITGIFAALFPCASITGAPKVKTMQIISQLENRPRGIYTGAIGYFAPERKACFNVAIRTLVIDKNTGAAEYGVGGGVVWDSSFENEYSECLLKAEILNFKHRDFKLLESMLWEPGTGIFILDDHLQRLTESALYFGYPLSIKTVRQKLHKLTKQLTRVVKIRLLVDELGGITLEKHDLPGDCKQNINISLASKPVDTEDPFLYHKTTRRDVYDNMLNTRPGYDDVILYNKNGEITESCFANIVVRINGTLNTPPVKCGLLPGAFRGELLKQGHIREKIITIDDLKSAGEVYLVNSVRKWVRVEL